jgi:hypothetical protein
MKAGKFDARSPLLFKNGKLIDGRHRLRGVIRSGVSIHFPIERVVDAARAKRNGMVDVAAALKAAEIVERELGAGRKARHKKKSGTRRRNSAGEIFEDFTGTRSTKVTTGYVAPNAPVNVDLLGPVKQLTLENGKRPVTIGSKRDGTLRTIMGEVKRFRNGAVTLNGIERANGRRRFVVGVLKEDRAHFLKEYPWAKGKNFTFGPVAEVVYYAAKPHLYRHNGKPDPRVHPHYHILGEEGGRRPTAMLKNGMPALAYGDYEIKSEGIRN